MGTARRDDRCGRPAAFARVADECGYDAIALPDSVFYPETVSADYPYSADGKRMWAPETPMPDPFIAMTAMAAVTARVRFYTNVLKLPLRDPLLTAKQVATMAVMSQNRIAVGVGLSWIPENSSSPVPRCALAVRAPTKPSRSSRRCVPARGRNGSNSTVSITISIV